ncbi:leucine rich adaptor protein 1-like [Branchiostoma floridae]|uniref:Leucine rich adaptor protein 1-like n=2 Tax=Branchiostoma floridae TaxID=7739 RepID=A0A9J7ND34_BRAFL|nr:leucine rich adaptor protein 1-like [Branchiostoma floridae]
MLLQNMDDGLAREIRELETKMGKIPTSLLNSFKEFNKEEEEEQGGGVDVGHEETEGGDEIDKERVNETEQGGQEKPSSPIDKQLSFVKAELKQIRQADIRLMHTFLAVNEGIEELKWLMDNSLHTPTSSMCSSLASLVDSRDVLNTISEEGAGFSPESPMRVRRNSDPGCRGGEHDQSPVRSHQRRESDQNVRTMKYGDISPQQLPRKIRYGLASPGAPHRRVDQTLQSAPFDTYLTANGSASTENTKCKDLAKSAQGTEDNWTLLV